MTDFRRTRVQLPQGPDSSCVVEASGWELVLLSMLWKGQYSGQIHTFNRPTLTLVQTIITAVLVFS